MADPNAIAVVPVSVKLLGGDKGLDAELFSARL